MSFDFSRPYKITVFTSINSILIGVSFLDDWLENEDITDPESFLEVVKNEDEEDYYEEIVVERKINKESKKNEKEIIMQFILNDSEFAYKKNQESRYWCFHDVMEKEEMKEFREILKPYGAPQIGNVKMFMDEAWQKYKEANKNK